MSHKCVGSVTQRSTRYRSIWRRVFPGNHWH